MLLGGEESHLYRLLKTDHAQNAGVLTELLPKPCTGSTAPLEDGCGGEHWQGGHLEEHGHR